MYVCVCLYACVYVCVGIYMRVNIRCMPFLRLPSAKMDDPLLFHLMLSLLSFWCVCIYVEECV